jgi:hypothetical protein
MGNFTQANSYASGQFADVDENEWYGFNRQKAIARAYEYGLMKGSGGNSFNPAGNMTVAEAVTIAARVHSIYNGGAGEFSQGSPWYKEYVDYATSNGIIDAGAFPDYEKAATRAEMAYIFSGSLPFYEFLKKNDVNSLPDAHFGSNPATGQPLTPYYGNIVQLYEAGVLAGNDEKGTFNPNSNISRAEAAAIISRVILPGTRFDGRTFG